MSWALYTNNTCHVLFYYFSLLPCVVDGTLCTVERLDPAVGAWELMAPMSVRRSDAAATTLGDRLYVFGGYVEPPPERLSVAEGFDPTLNTWVRLPDPQSAR